MRLTKTYSLMHTLVNFSNYHHLQSVRFELYINHKYIKIVESDWSSAGLNSTVIVQLYTSCLSNWTVRVINYALIAIEWVIFFSILLRS